MNFINGVMATSHKSIADFNPSSFTPQQLDKLQKSAIDKPVLMEFDMTKPPIGVITEAKIENERLSVTAKMSGELPKNKFFLAPCYRTEPFELICCGITRTPSDPTVTPIRGTWIVGTLQPSYRIIPRAEQQKCCANCHYVTLPDVWGWDRPLCTFGVKRGRFNITRDEDCADVAIWGVCEEHRLDVA